MHSCGEPYVGGLRRLVGSSVGRVVSELPIILPQRRLHLTRVVEPETLAQPVRIPYGRNGSVDAISRAERGEAKVFPIPIVIVEEADARVSRSPRSIRSKSATGSSCVRRLQDLLTILKKGDHGWIRTGHCGLDDVAVCQVRRTFPRLKIPIAAVWAIPTSDMTIRMVRHHATVGFISRNVSGRNRCPQSKFDFMAAIARRHFIDSNFGRHCLCRPPRSSKNSGGITKLGRLVDAISNAMAGLHVAPQTVPGPKMAFPEARSTAVSPDPSSALADGFFRL